MTTDTGSTRVHPRPFLKWAGGKSQLLAQFAPLYPRFEGYHEPFVGSAAVFFHLCQLEAQGRLGHALARARLTDSNAELINCYCVVRDQVDALIASLARHKQRHSAEYYYDVRRHTLSDLSPVERAARLIYLNKTCYNGLYRVNRQGQFNVPLGAYQQPGIFDAQELRAASAALQTVELAVADFRGVLHHAHAGDLVYFDPPYHPLNKTSSFTSYTQAAFGEQEQRELAQLYRALADRGCRVMLSNSWSPLILDLYRGFRLVEVKAARAINSKPERRGKISELVVLNFDPSDGQV